MTDTTVTDTTVSFYNRHCIAQLIRKEEVIFNWQEKQIIDGWKWTQDYSRKFYPYSGKDNYYLNDFLRFNKAEGDYWINIQRKKDNRTIMEYNFIILINKIKILPPELFRMTYEML